MIEGVDLDVLRAWMDRKALGQGPIGDVERLSGGTQNILLRFTRADRRYVLRRPPVHLRANSNETMRREARVLAALAGSDVPHPALIAGEPDESLLGAAFYLMAPVDGFAAPNGLPPLHCTAPVQHRMGLAMVEAIAALGALDYRAVGLDGFGKTDNYLGRQVARWQAQLESYAELPGWTGPAMIPGVTRVADWLAANVPADFRAGIIHGDFHLGNVMFCHDSGNIAAVVDWELCTIGDPRLDLGWMLATWPEGDAPAETDVAFKPWVGFPTASELVAHYSARSDRDLGSIDWFVVLACYKLGIILEGTHARACAGKAPRETGDRLHAQTIALFERALRRIG